jgi:hypothetical protein
VQLFQRSFLVGLRMVSARSHHIVDQLGCVTLRRFSFLHELLVEAFGQPLRGGHAWTVMGTSDSRL